MYNVQSKSYINISKQKTLKKNVNMNNFIKYNVIQIDIDSFLDNVNIYILI